MSLLHRRMMFCDGVRKVPINVDLAEIYGVEVKGILGSNGFVSRWNPGIVSAYIPCDVNSVYKLKTTCFTWEKVCFYDLNKNFISAEGFGGFSSGTFQFGKSTKYQVPDTAIYFRCQLKGEQEGNYYIMKIS